MKPVNLLPERYRPRTQSGGNKSASYIFLGALGALLLALAFYVLTLNSINASRGKVAEAKAHAAHDNAAAAQLGPYGDFAKIKTQRVGSVMALAQGRFDFERLIRELAHVLPEGVWITNATAGLPAQGAAPPSSSTPAAGSTPTTQTLTIQGCAPSQPQVAVTLVRLHELQGATDVALDHSTRPEVPKGAKGALTASSGTCGATLGNPNYGFTASVKLVANPRLQAPTPNALGGGA